MSDQPIPTAADDSDPEKARRNSEIREAVLDEVTLANDVAIAGRKPEYLSRLLEDALEEPQLVDLEEAVKTVRGLITTVGGKRSDTRHSTREQNKLRDALLIQLGKVRALAKKVYERGNPRRADYYIGKQVDKSRAFLCQVSESMITHAKTDPVLKISPRLLTAFQGAFDAYMAERNNQTDKRTEASEEIQALSEAAKELAVLRRAVQYAADATWPAREKLHAPIRREFRLPINRGLV